MRRLNNSTVLFATFSSMEQKHTETCSKAHGLWQTRHEAPGTPGEPLVSDSVPVVSRTPRTGTVRTVKQHAFVYLQHLDVTKTYNDLQ